MGTLPTPAYALPVIFPNGTFDAIAIGPVNAYIPAYGSDNFYIIWENQDNPAQGEIIDLVDSYGGTVPFAGAKAGFQGVNFKGTAAAGNSTGLDATVFGSGSHTYTYFVPKVGANPTGLPLVNTNGLSEVVTVVTRGVSSSPNTLAGKYFLVSSTTTNYYVWFNNNGAVDATINVTFAGGILTGVSLTNPGAGYTDGTGFSFFLTTSGGGGDGAAQIGYDVVNGEFTNVSILAGGTTYTNGTSACTDVPTSASVDPAPGGTGIAVDVELDYLSYQVATAVKDAIVAAAPGVFEVVATGNFVTIKVVIQAAPFGVAGAGTSSFTVVATQTGVAPTARTFTATVYVDGVANPVSVLGSAAQTFTTLITQINADLTGAVAAIDGNGNITITSASTGPLSTVFIDDVDLFANTNDNKSAATPVVGAGTRYAADVIVDGTTHNLVINGASAATFGALATAMTTAFGGAATVTVSGTNDLLITSATTGNSSSVVVSAVVTPNPSNAQYVLWSKLRGFASFNEPRSGAAAFVDALFLNRNYGTVEFYRLGTTVGP